MSTELIAFLVIVYIIGMPVSRYIYFRVTTNISSYGKEDEIMGITFFWPLALCLLAPLLLFEKVFKHADELGKKHRKK